MSKKSRAGIARVVIHSAPRGLANWLARRSRLTRSALAGICALILAGTLGLVLYGYMLSLPEGGLNIGPFTPEVFLNLSLVLCAVVGVAAYYLGWRLLIGFDADNKAFKPGRSAAIFVLVSLVVLIVTVAVMVVNAVIAVSGGS